MVHYDYNQILGMITLNGVTSFYLGEPAEWVMDYQKYDPTYNPQDWNYIFRGNILYVDENNAQSFIDTMGEYQLKEDEIESFLQEFDDEDIRPLVLIDFDQKNFVNNFYDISFEKYIPRHWKGIFDDPLKYVDKRFIKSWK